MERTAYLKIDPHTCHSCARCKAAQACRLRAIIQIDPGEQPFLDPARCRDCRVCVAACPYGAVRKMQ